VNDLVDAIATMLGDILGLPIVGVAGRLVAIVMGVLWLASAWWVWRDMAIRSDEPLYRYVATAGIVLSTPILFPLALLLYVVLRPPERDEPSEALERRLVELGERRNPERCPSCTQRVERHWRRCPACGQVLAVACPTCGEAVGLDWQVCAWCASDLPWSAEEAEPSGPAPVAIPIVPGGRPLVPVMAVPETPAEPEPDQEQLMRSAPRRRG
jgi:hypothetical protein